MFCCGAMIEADFKRNQLLVWNGGLPDGWLAHLSGERRALPSRHLPLGIRNAEQFDAGMDVINTRPGDRILMMSDGIPEARNQAGEAFGEAGIVRALDEQRQKQHPFDAVMESIRQFTGQHGGDDDLTLLCLEMVDEADFSTVRDQDGVSGRATQSALSGPGEWHCVYEIRERSLSTFNPLPLLLHICMEVPGLRRKSGEVYTLLTELTVMLWSMEFSACQRSGSKHRKDLIDTIRKGSSGCIWWTGILFVSVCTIPLSLLAAACELSVKTVEWGLTSLITRYWLTVIRR
jgi:hypothetical protein